MIDDLSRVPNHLTIHRPNDLNMPSILETSVMQMMQKGKGLLAADESNRSVPKRLDPIGVESTPENRRRFRELYLSAPGAEEYLSGVILYDETLRQADSDGTPFAKVLSDRGIVPGIKVDAGAKDIAAFPGETLTEGLDGLADRLTEYYDLGARFAKWRAVIHIGKELPTQEMIDANSLQLALYALRCQEANIVPMVEPEVVLKGKHTIEKAEDITTATLTSLIEHLQKYRVDLKTTVVKTSMVVPGSASGQPMNPEQVAEATARCLRATIPDEAGGVVFLSGGQSSEEATMNLNAIAKLGPYPWNVTFTFARALQYPAIEIWAGKDENIKKAREAFMERLKANAAASIGAL
ncbi:fructose-bisphosphate aldolase class I [Candidatus Uhrbacteria bacterium]|nr:fructose-bisphosphate aldolase class I [Candidatus Uhrbacteria bacterium]MBD3284053.1 fructose-bisphosphate aldolase class I [Candidatus Uhrbacteria bacterium]